MKEQKLHLRRKKNERDKESSYLWLTSLHMWHKPEEITILLMPFFRFYFVSILFILISYNNLFLYKNKLLYINSLHYFFLVIYKM